MTTDLEERLARHLRRAADDAPATGLRLATVTDRARRRRSTRTIARATVVLAVVGAGAGLIAVRSPDSEPAPAAGPPAVTPVGAESALATLPDVRLDTDIVKPGALALQLADGQRLTFAITAMPLFDGYVQQSTIAFDTYSIGRLQPPGVDLPLVPEPQLGGNDRMTFWTGLPDAVAFVELHATDGTRWQRPVEGIVAFPVAVRDAADTLIAFGADGTEIARTTWAAASFVTTGETDGVVTHDYSSLEWSDTSWLDVELVEGLTQEQETRYRAQGDDVMRACLARGEADWNACLGEADAAVKAALAAMAAPA